MQCLFSLVLGLHPQTAYVAENQPTAEVNTNDGAELADGVDDATVDTREFGDGSVKFGDDVRAIDLDDGANGKIIDWIAGVGWLSIHR